MAQIIYKRFYFIYMCMWVYVHVWGCSWRSEVGRGSPESKATGIFDLANLSTVIQMPVLYKSSKCFLFTPKLVFFQAPVLYFVLSHTIELSNILNASRNSLALVLYHNKLIINLKYQKFKTYYIRLTYWIVTTLQNLLYRYSEHCIGLQLHKVTSLKVYFMIKCQKCYMVFYMVF